MANVDVTRIASNIGALNALNSLQNINAKLALHQTRLSTGKRINSAQDDPAGLTIATKMLARSEGLKVSMDNISDAKNMLSVAEGGLSKMTDIIVQMRSKAEQAASDTIGSSERAAIQDQLSAYATQIQDLVDQTKWNGVKLLDNTSGNKVFQTGVDEGETTTWTLPAALDPSTLNLSTKVTADTATYTFTTDSFTAGAQTSTLGSMTELTTGDYQFEILDTATSGTQGKATLDTSSALVTGLSNFSHTTTAATGSELASGRYNFNVTNVTSSTSVDYLITNFDDNTTITATGVDLVTSAGDLLVTGGGAKIGAKLSFGTNPGALIAGQSMNFEYIKSNQAKLELNDATGQAIQISKNAGGTISGLYSYGTQGAAYDSGRGVQVTVGTFANLAKGEIAKLNYKQANNYSVDVSTTVKAGAYMTTANYALDKVNSALSGLGSLMARLSFKEEAISTAQVNVEGAYNRIMNANMAEEQVNASKYTILQQTATAMLAQANAAPQSLLALFR